MGKYSLALGTAVYDDFDGLFFTIKSIQVYHRHIFDQAEIIVVDNNPRGIDADSIKHFLNEINQRNNIKLIRMEYPRGTAPAKQKVIDSATADWVVVFDCHVLFEPKAFDYFLKCIEEEDHERDIISGPLMSADGKAASSHFHWKWRGQLLGIWGSSPQAQDPDAPPFEIIGVGTGMFAVYRRKFPGFHPAFRGFGSEELYIHEKVRRAGGRAICVPGFRWHHRFHRPRGVPYPNLMWDRVRNYVIGFKELGFPLDEIYNYYVGGGFFTQSDWDYLIADPIGRETPPQFFEIADDAPEKPRIVKSLTGHRSDSDQQVQANQQQASDMKPIPQSYQSFIERGGSVSAELEKRVREQISKIPDEVLEKIPIPDNVMQEIRGLPESEQAKLIRVYREGVMFQNWKKTQQAVPQNPDAVQGGGPQKGCGGCGARQEVHNPEIRKDVVESLKGIQSLQALNSVSVPSEVHEVFQKIIADYTKSAKRILDISDDPGGITKTIITNLSEDAVLVSFYADMKYAPEINELARIATTNNRAVKMVIGKPEDFAVRDTTFDFAVIDPVIPDADSVYSILKKVLPFVKGRVIIHKTEKYGSITPDKKPGIVPAISRFLNEDNNYKEWSVIKVYREGLGLYVLSNLKEDKPKLPSAIKMASNFMRAVATHIATGAKEVDKKELEFRLNQCSICEYRSDDRCSICGCYIVGKVSGQGKAYWKDQKCPLGKWELFKENKHE